MSTKIKLLLIKDNDSKLLDKILYEVLQIPEEEIISLVEEDSWFDLDSRIVRINPSVIVPIGEKALNRFDLSGIVKHAGELLEYNGVPLVPVFSPGFVERNHSQLKKFAEDLHTAYQVAHGIKKEKATTQILHIENMIDFWRMIDYIKETGYVSFDFETTRITDRSVFDPDFRLISVAFSFQQGSAYVLLLDHPDGWIKDKQRQEIVQMLNDDVFGNPKVVKIGHHVKFDMHCAANLGITSFRGQFHCTMIMSHLLDENSSNKLKDCVRYYFPQFANYESGIKSHDWNRIATKDLIKYNALDADLTFRLYWLFTELLFLDGRLYTHYRNIDAPATKVLFKMERRGMLIDKAFLLDAIQKTEGKIQETENKMYLYPEVVKYNNHLKEVRTQELCKEFEEKLTKERDKIFKSEKAKQNQEKRIKQYEQTITDLQNQTIVPDVQVNMASPQQLLNLLYGKHGFNFIPYADEGGREQLSTDKKVLEYVEDKTGFLNDLIQFRQMRGILNKDLTGILKRLDQDHKVHTSFSQHVTKTGRLSSKEPNLQNVITRTKFKKIEELVKLVKQSFVPPKGYKLLQMDYSQAELRLMAYYANDPIMLKAYQSGQDLHALTAAKIQKLTLEQFYKQDETTIKTKRFHAKAANFGFIYGISAFGFQHSVRIDYGIKLSRKQSEQYRESFFKTYPNILKYHYEYIQKARKFGQVRTFFGRAVRILDIYSPIGGKRKHAENNAVNSPIQGTAGEMTIFALALLDNRLPFEILIVNSVHDNSLFYIPDDKLSYIPLIKDTMENLPLKEYFGKKIEGVKMLVDVELSDKSWGDLEKYS